MITRKIVSTGKFRKFDLNKKDSETRNNARNRDGFTICKANNTLEQIDKIHHYGNSLLKSTLPNETEDALIELIDFVNAKKEKTKS